LGRIFTDFGGLPGSHLIAGTYATGSFTDFDAQGWLIFRDIGSVPLLTQQEGSWLGAYVFDQKLWVDPCNEKRNVGLWGMAGWSDPNTSPYDWTMNVSIEAQGPTARRQHDRAGIGYFYQGLSEPFTDALGGVLARTVRDVQGGEAYYNYQVTPWFNLTTDVQVIQSEFADQDTAWVIGLRGKITL
jgi:porin